MLWQTGAETREAQAASYAMRVTPPPGGCKGPPLQAVRLTTLSPELLGRSCLMGLLPQNSTTFLPKFSQNTDETSILGLTLCFMLSIWSSCSHSGATASSQFRDKTSSLWLKMLGLWMPHMLRINQHEPWMAMVYMTCRMNLNEWCTVHSELEKKWTCFEQIGHFLHSFAPNLAFCGQGASTAMQQLLPRRPFNSSSKPRRKAASAPFSHWKSSNRSRTRLAPASKNSKVCLPLAAPWLKKNWFL